ncbi:MAG: hypothetical protein CBB92_13405, partial [Flammeovirgaceae bacterium TMED32]
NDDRIGAIIPVPASFTNVLIKLPIAELEEGINKILGQQLFDGGFALNKKKDSLFLKIKLEEHIDIEYYQGRFHLALPLNISAIIKSRLLGVAISNAGKPIKFQAKAELSSELNIDERWDLEFDSRWETITWNVPPNFKVLGLKIDLAELIEKEIQIHERPLEKIINEILKDQIDIRAVVERLYRSIQKPLRVSATALPLYFTNEAISLRGDFVKVEINDTLFFQLEHQSILRINDAQNNHQLSEVLPLRTNPLSRHTQISFFVELRLSFLRMEEVMDSLLVGKEFNLEGIAAKVNRVEISPHEGFLKWNLTVEGDINGIISLFVVPSIDEYLVMQFSAFDYELPKMEGWAKMTDWAMHRAIEKYVVSQSSYDMSPFLYTLDDRIVQELNKSPLSKKIALDLNLNTFTPYSKGMNEDEIQFIFQIEGRAALSIKDKVFVRRE